MEWTWRFFDFDPFVLGFLNEAARWAVANAVTIMIINLILNWIQQRAIKLEEIKDNSRLSLLGYYTVRLTKVLTYVFSFKWLTKFRSTKRD